MGIGTAYFKSQVDALLALKLNKPEGGTPGQALVLQPDGTYIPTTIVVNSTPYTDEQAQDAIGKAIALGNHSGITITYGDESNALSFSINSAQLDQIIANLINLQNSATWTALQNTLGNSTGSNATYVSTEMSDTLLTEPDNNTVVA